MKIKRFDNVDNARCFWSMLNTLGYWAKTKTLSNGFCVYWD